MTAPGECIAPVALVKYQVVYIYLRNECCNGAELIQGQDYCLFVNSMSGGKEEIKNGCRHKLPR